MSAEVEKRVPFTEKWYPFVSISSNMVIMVRHSIKGVTYAPFYIHRFPLLQPHLLAESEKFNLQYSDLAEIESTSDKLRCCRYRKGLLQRDVADYAGIDRSTYLTYEEETRELFPLDKMELIAQLFEVPVTDLLDEYNMFLYNGQGKQIKALRKSMGLTQTQFGKHFGVGKGEVVRWECNKVVVCKITWEKIFKSGIAQSSRKQ